MHLATCSASRQPAADLHDVRMVLGHTEITTTSYDVLSAPLAYGEPSRGRKNPPDSHTIRTNGPKGPTGGADFELKK